MFRTKRIIPNAVTIAASIAAVAAVMFICAAGRPASVAADDGFFSQAAAEAQKRTVKVYGASIGRVTGYATGIIVSADGQIITAQGVHLNAQRIRVTLPDGSLHEANLVRTSNALQLALLKIDAATPDFFALSDKPVADKGDWVLAVSNAFKVADGPEPLSVNLGVISLRTRLDARHGTQDVEYAGDVLLIDAITSNPGAAGGAIVTADGHLAGMIGKILEGKTTNTRLNYAVPSDLLLKFLNDEEIEEPATTPLAAGKAVLGIRLFALGGRNAPAYIDRVIPGTPAAEVELRPDDLVVSIAGSLVRNVREYDEALEALRPGDEITLVVKRRNKLVQVQITPVAEEE